MAAPHPTRSKPAKIGRKHTKAGGIRAQAKADKARRYLAAKRAAEHRRFKAQVRQFFGGLIDEFPAI